MNFIKETDPYLRELDAWKKGHGWSNRESLQRLAYIWDEFKNIPERKMEIYGSLNSILPKTDLSCGSCVGDMLKFVWNWRAKLEHEVTVYFQGVPQAVVETPEERHPDAIVLDKAFDDFLVKQHAQENIAEIVDAKSFGNPELKPEVDKLVGKKMHELRAIAKRIGITYSNKTTSAELIKLINDRA